MMERDGLQERSSESGEEMTEERFLKDLYLFMKQRDTPIERIPHLGFKQIDMFLMYKTVKELGGYQQVTTQQLWKKVYNILGGNPRSTSAATCTRRHYEKLLLPYECHQNGYRDDIVFRMPRSQKRFHSSSYDFEHEYPRNGKRADFRHLPAFPQTSPNMFPEHQRQVFNMPLNVASYLPHGSTSLPNYIALRESALPQLSLNPSQDVPQTPASYLGTSSVEDQICKQPLDRLRYLAKEYKSSSGLEEPLNLSRKENSLETLSDTPSSFAPPPSKKPKFLNEASPLYPPRGLTTEEGAEQEETVDETTSGEGSAGTVRAGQSPVITDVIDLTSNANPVPRRASPPSVNLFNRRMNYSEAFSMKARERDLYADWWKEESTGAPTPKLGGILNQRSALGHPPVDPNGKMEIQIPLKLLQELIRRGLVSNQAFTGNGPVPQNPTKPEAQPAHKLSMRSHSETSESSTTCEEPANMSLKSPFRNLSDMIPRDNGIKKLQMFQGNSYLKHSLDRDIHKPFQPKQAQVPMTNNHESMSVRPPSYSEDTPLSLTMKHGRKLEKVMAPSNTGAKEISASPPLTSDHIRFLLAHLPYRLESGQTF
ncbi:AT-rich interaction domain 6 [Chanodichthys erythropterus]|uniref:AT-rich interaction domain 6 n=1 Tax=Chanodichthys erythropterus TaxID=933992 RepID=UPI00351F73AC